MATEGTAAVMGRCCLSIDGRFSLSLVLVDGRVLEETIFGASDEGVFEASVTPLPLFDIVVDDANGPSAESF